MLWPLRPALARFTHNKVPASASLYPNVVKGKICRLLNHLQCGCKIWRGDQSDRKEGDDGSPSRRDRIRLWIDRC